MPKAKLTPRAHNFKDLTGQRFGRLVAIEVVGKRANRDSLWKVHCDCGRTKVVPGRCLKRGRSKSCGCRPNPGNYQHGKSGSRTHATWLSMQQRCNNPKAASYGLYGGRGISICERWKSFTAFLEDMGERPPGTSIERINNEFGYFKGNCRWATPAEQAKNRRLPSFRPSYIARDSSGRFTRGTS
jgi:hypothetical protein